MNVRDVLPRDAIQSIDAPEFGSSYFGDGDDEVIVVEGSPARAYPIRVLSYHEIVNDAIESRPIAVTWCPICWSSVVYDRRVDGRPLTFGVSGKLADDALVMYDRETETEWKQPTGEAISGLLDGENLDTLAAGVTTWNAFRERYPDGVVLQPPTPMDTAAARDRYDMAPYTEYADRSAFGLHGMRGEGDPRLWDREDIDAKTVVFGFEASEAAVGYPLPSVRAAGGVVTDTVGGRDIVVVATEETVGAFENPGFEFAVDNEELRGDGTTWNPVTGESGDGRRLTPVAGRRLFAFAWQDAHGPDAFYASAASSTS